MATEAPYGDKEKHVSRRRRIEIAERKAKQNLKKAIQTLPTLIKYLREKLTWVTDSGQELVIETESQPTEAQIEAIRLLVLGIVRERKMHRYQFGVFGRIVKWTQCADMVHEDNSIVIRNITRPHKTRWTGMPRLEDLAMLLNPRVSRQLRFEDPIQITLMLQEEDDSLDNSELILMLLNKLKTMENGLITNKQLEEIEEIKVTRGINPERGKPEHEVTFTVIPNNTKK